MDKHHWMRPAALCEKSRLGSEAAGANPSSFVDASLVQELEKDLSFQQRNR